MCGSCMGGSRQKLVINVMKIGVHAQNSCLARVYICGKILAIGEGGKNVNVPRAFKKCLQPTGDKLNPISSPSPHTDNKY